MVCSGRCRFELSAPFFSIEEHDGSILNVEASFAPPPTWRTFLFRTALLAYAVANYCYDIFETPSYNRWTFLFYLTRWGGTSALLYFFLSLILTVTRSALEQPDDKSPTNLSFLVKCTWAAYALAFPLSIAICILFWTLQYNGGTITYRMLTHHAISMVLVGIDGVFIGLIPVRLKHLVLLTAVGLAYAIWTVIHYFSGIGNGDFEGEDPEDEVNDDVLYDVINWGDNPTSTTISLVMIICVLNPICFLVARFLSFWSFPCGSRRRILKEATSEPEQYTEGAENGNNFNNETSIWAQA